MSNISFEEAVAGNRIGLKLPDNWGEMMKEKEKEMEPNNKVYRTSNYKIFKYLTGNRNVDMSRVNKVMDSINANGYILNPIVVNEKMEIIDGQARRVALEQLGMPVDYVVAYGAGVMECVALNRYSTTWGLMNYVKSHADLGDLSYVYFLQLMKEFQGVFPISVVFYAAKGKLMQGGKNNVLTNGKFEMSQEEYESARETLEKMKEIRDIIRPLAGNQFYYTAIIWMMRRDEVDVEHLFKNVKNRQGDIRPVVSCEDAIDVLSDVYNFWLKKKLFYLSVAYKEEKTKSSKGLYTINGHGRRRGKINGDE